jgi:hypothetical protein
LEVSIEDPGKIAKTGKDERRSTLGIGQRQSFPVFSKWPGSAIIPDAMLDLLLQFGLELVRALLVDELSGRVRRRLINLISARRSSDGRRTILDIHRRTKERLLHRLLTEREEDP